MAPLLINYIQILTGCMERVYINSRLMDLNLGQQHKIGPGCGGEEAVGDQGSHMMHSVKPKFKLFKKKSGIEDIPRQREPPIRPDYSSNAIEVSLFNLFKIIWL